ncbi:hypothetical protein N7468_009867 [Penicillium chermesinum]|uniref:Uncharacterized protein n=1 Tax=Penicillium chermesinum TaxID=63820 RepID=A0A9W9TBZ6_9EURO|nr:uncharacterized protein N7468_009867 [Penicillium chermesinum]KAJ5216859.1 hypothetical protein N7468_009867 [Penicillium chermesinum]
MQGDWQTFIDILAWGHNARPTANSPSSIGFGDTGRMTWGPNAVEAVDNETRILGRLMAEAIAAHALENGFKLSSHKTEGRAKRVPYSQRIDQKRALRIQSPPAVTGRGSCHWGSPPTLADTLVRLEPGDALFPVIQAGIRSFFMGVALGGASGISM